MSIELLFTMSIKTARGHKAQRSYKALSSLKFLKRLEHKSDR